MHLANSAANAFSFDQPLVSPGARSDKSDLSSPMNSPHRHQLVAAPTSPGKGGHHRGC